MSSMQENPYQASYSGYNVAALADEWDRTVFIRRTYAHLAGAIAAFVGIEVVLFSLFGDMVGPLVHSMTNSWNWLIVLGAFMFVSWIANQWAVSTTSLGTQYLGLGLYVVAEAVIFLPLLYVAQEFAPDAIPAAALMTGIVFAGLTLYVFVSKANLAGWGKYLAVATWVALGLIVASIFVRDFNLGGLFSAVMIAVASGYILYETSNVLHHYRTDQYVAASLALFASVAILFWYILRLVLALSSRD